MLPPPQLRPACDVPHPHDGQLAVISVLIIAVSNRSNIGLNANNTFIIIITKQNNNKQFGVFYFFTFILLIFSKFLGICRDLPLKLNMDTIYRYRC